MTRNEDSERIRNAFESGPSLLELRRTVRSRRVARGGRWDLDSSDEYCRDGLVTADAQSHFHVARRMSVPAISTKEGP